MDIFAAAGNQHCLFSRDQRQFIGNVEGTKLALCVEHRHQNRSGRESRVCKYWAALTARIPVNQSEEKITI